MMIDNQNIMTNEIANSMVTNTLLTSMKTGSPIIDAITSLVFISDFKNKYTKNITIITVLLFGILFHKATKDIDFLNLLYKLIIKKCNEKILQKINKEHIVTGIAYNKYEDIYFKEQFNLIALLCQVNKLHKDIDYEILTDRQIIGYYYSPSGETVYLRIMKTKKHNNDNNYIQNTIIKPPLSSTWYKLDNDIEFYWNIIDKDNNNNDKLHNDYCKFKYIVKSKNMTTEELNNYIDKLRTAVIDDIERLGVEQPNKNMSFSEGQSYKIKTISSEKGMVSHSLVQKSSFNRNINSLFFKEKDKLIRLLDTFDNKIGVYNKLQHRHKIGILIYGKPGNGKTSLSVAIATYLKRDILSVSLSDPSLNDSKLSYIFSQHSSSKVIILDELDTHKALRPRTSDNESETFSIEEDKKDDSKQEKLTIGGFLESLDGVSSNKGRVVIAITNHPDHLDPAILRPGRFDIIINMVSLDNESIKLYLEYLLENKYSDEIIDTCDYCKNFEISTSIIEQAVIEKYSNPDKKLVDCVKDINESFLNLNSQHRK